MAVDTPAGVPRQRSGLATALRHVVLPLTLGFFFYLLWRPTSLWMFVWFDSLGATSIVRALRELAGPFPPQIPSFVLFNFPAACWSYSLSVAIALIWREAPAFQQRAVRAVLLAIAIGGEVVQVVPEVPGVFDPIDCAFNVVAACLGMAVVSHHRGVAWS